MRNSLKSELHCWRAGSAVKSTDSSFKGAKLNFQYPHGDSQL